MTAARAGEQFKNSTTLSAVPRTDHQISWFLCEAVVVDLTDSKYNNTFRARLLQSKHFMHSWHDRISLPRKTLQPQKKSRSLSHLHLMNKVLLVWQ